MTERVCVSVTELRKKYNDNDINLKKWLETEDNIYVGRRGRIFINGEIFHYKDSDFRNPFKVSEHGRDHCLELFDTYLKNKIDNDELDIKNLKNKKLGCFCRPHEKCHVDILIKYIK